MNREYIKQQLIRYGAAFVFAVALAALLMEVKGRLLEQLSFASLTERPEETVKFRNMAFDPRELTALKADCAKMDADWIPLFAAAMLDGDFFLGEAENSRDMEYLKMRVRGYERRNPEAFGRLCDSYRAVLSDLVYFPIPLSTRNEKAVVSFENSWMYERSFGGIRGHEGTDLMPSVPETDLYPVVSMTGGIVENVGWLTKGGYRIGIRSPHGGYFYYAHLSAYAKEFQKGDTVAAGELLGYMGNTGYGEEGTTGMFDVHLHLGIYIRTEQYKERSVNPYWVLRFLEDSRLRYNF